MIENKNTPSFMFGNQFCLDINAIKINSNKENKEIQFQDVTTTSTFEKTVKKDEKEELPEKNEDINKEVLIINDYGDNLNKKNENKDNINKEEEFQKEKEKKCRGAAEVKEEKKIQKNENKKDELISINNQINNNITSKIKIENNNKTFNQNINFNNNTFKRINNGLYTNNNNILFNQMNKINNTVGFNNNINNIYNYNNHNLLLYIQKLNFIIQQKYKFEELKRIGLYALLNSTNLNNYLLNINNNNNLNISYNQNNINPLMPFNNNINYNVNNINFNALQNPLNNYLANHLNNQKKPEKYTIILKSKTNNPNVEKISKIKVTTSYKKDISKTNKENSTQSKKAKNFINIEDIISGNEKRTVIRLNPIPSNYSSFDVSKLLDNYLKIEHGKNQRIYKALYAPLCKIIGKNLGYCFVMMAKPKYVVDFYKLFNGKCFGIKNCKKPCNVIWADIQGDEFLKLNEEDPLRKPIIFTDIRDD